MVLCSQAAAGLPLCKNRCKTCDEVEKLTETSLHYELFIYKVSVPNTSCFCQYQCYCQR